MKAARSSRILFWVLLAALVVGLVGWVGYRACCTYTVRYWLSGNATQAQVFTIQYDLLQGLIATTEQVVLPWERTIRSARLLTRPSASLRALASDPSVPLTCEVWINNVRVDQQTAIGAVGCLFDPAKQSLP
jgi:hypothetical protein